MNSNGFIRLTIYFIAVLCVLGAPLDAARAADKAVTYYYTDQQGTVLATADAAGNVTSTADYRPYGPRVSGVPAPGPGFTGHLDEPDSGLVYMQQRYLDPQTGRFLSVDSVTSNGNGDGRHFNR